MENQKEVEELFFLRNNTKIRILNLLEEGLATVSELKNKLDMAYKNVIANLNFLEEHGKIIRLSLEEQNNPSYVIPLQSSDNFSTINEIEKSFNFLVSFSKHISIKIFLPRENINNSVNELREIEKILLLVQDYPDLKFDLNISCIKSNIKRYRMKIEFISKKIESIIIKKIKNMNKEDRAKIKLDLNGFIKLLS